MKSIASAETIPVALVGLSLYGEDADILRGIRRYTRRCGNWILETAAHDVREFAFEHLNRTPGGIIAHVAAPSLADRLQQRDIPVINLSGVMPDQFPFPHVGINQRRIGEMAARHLVDLGLKHLAVPFPPGLVAHHYLNERLAGFLAELNRHALPPPFCLTQQVETPTERLLPTPALAGEMQLMPLAKLPTPCGIFAVTDRFGLMINEDCLALGLRVPEEISIVGAGNLEILCQLSHPELSSISGPMEEVGFQAAQMLHRLLRGEPVPQTTLLSGPIHVHIRGSSSQIMVEDPLVREVLIYIRDHVREGINVAAVATAFPVTRRTLELRFKKVTGEGILDRIHRVRLGLASELLAESSESVKSIARLCGYTSAEHMSRAFMRYLKQSPRDLRNQASLADA
jgi:LacI family transcriptional regulator